MKSVQESDLARVELDVLSQPLLDEEEHSVLSEGEILEKKTRSNGSPESRSTLFLLMLTISLGGLQVLFSVLYSHGITHLCSLGLDRSEAAMTFVAGPICGIFLQPCFGFWSDHCKSSSWGMRRPFIAYGVAAVIVSVLGLAWTMEITTLFFPTHWHTASTAAQNPAVPSIAVILTICVFIAIQPVQSGTRALIADACPPQQQQEANGWASRVTGIASVLGYLSAFMDLPQYLSWFGDTQFKNLSVLISLSLGVSAALTCTFISEAQRPMAAKETSNEKELTNDSMLLTLSWAGNFLGSVVRIPKQIMYIYSIQLFAWMGWYPYLLYVSTYVSDIYIARHGADSPHTGGQEILIYDIISTHATRLGAFALLISSIVAFLTAIALPFLTQLLHSHSPNSARHSSQIWKIQHIMASSLGMRRIWIVSHALFALCLFSTILVSSVLGTVIIFGFVGVSWAIANWIPYTLLSIEISKLGEEKHKLSPYLGSGQQPKFSAGTVFGMHNIAICIPQVLISLGSSFFWGLHDDTTKRDPGSVGWVLRIGGAMALVALWITTKIHDPGMDGESTESNLQSESLPDRSEGVLHIPYRVATVV